MSAPVIAAIITATAALIAAIIGGLFARKKSDATADDTRTHDIRGSWKSVWGPLPSGPPKNEELLVLTEQHGSLIKGYATLKTEPRMKWDVEGRYYDNTILQLLYYPSPESVDKDAQANGFYFLRRNTTGTFTGISAGYGTQDDGTPNQIFADFHEISRLQQ